MSNIQSDFENFINNFDIQECGFTFLMNYSAETRHTLLLLLFLCYFLFIKLSILLRVESLTADALIYNDLDTVSLIISFYGFYHIVFRLLLLFLIFIIYYFLKNNSR